MKTRIKFLLLVFSPFFINGQVSTFKFDDTFSTYFSDTISASNFDPTEDISVDPRLFGVSSLSNNQAYSSYLLGASLSANIRNKITLMSTYDYLGGNHNSLIHEYQDSLGVFPGFALENKRWQLNVR